jgi:hypothetical protein
MVEADRGTRVLYLQHLCGMVDRLAMAIASPTVKPQEHCSIGKRWARMNSSA